MPQEPEPELPRGVFPLNGPMLASDWTDYLDEICVPLTQTFGCRFDLVNTGGWCMAMQAILENGDHLLITDAKETLSAMPVRRRCWRNDREILGYAVGYYADTAEGNEMLAYVSFPKARDAQAVAIAVRACLAVASQVKAGQAERGTELTI